MSVSPFESASATPTVTAPADRHHLRRWGLAYGCYTLATNLAFTRAVWVIFLATRGYSPFAIGLFEMCFHLGKFIAEIPTGAFADLVGRRAALVVSCVIGALSELMFVAPVAPVLVASFALSGVAYAFRGGADSALLWTLAAKSGDPNQAARYSRLFSRMFLVMLFGELVGTASGGALASVAILLPFLCAGAALALGIAPLLLLPEASVERPERPRMAAHVAAGMRAAWRDPTLVGLLLISGLTASVWTTIGYYTQLYFNALGFSLAAIGLIFALSIVPDALVAAAAPRVLGRLPGRVILPAAIGAEALGILLMSAQQRALGLLGFVVFFHAADSLIVPAISRYLNERSPEAQRATVLSLDTGLFSAAMIVLFPLFGLGLTHTTYSAVYSWTALALVGGCAAIYGLSRALGRARE